MEVIQNKSFFDFQHSLDKTENNIYVLSFNATVLVKFQNIFLRNYINVLNANGKYVPFIGGGVADLCKYLNNRKGNKFMRVLVSKFKGSNNFATSCPIEPGVYHADDIIFDGNSFITQFIPDGKLMAAVELGTKINGKMNYFFKTELYLNLMDPMKWEKERSRNDSQKGSKV
ncbi:CLUMA_CG005343, isoform A [Clunio marinus]|uniref:CLUMA_CG005343, isoform A n=1 Tax=Clunio marinus TaxID=568069 RepID=A0A1J1HUE9_9DIPT|nr:CLUMA_CG005343, isoform A [Clunio marinus]